MENKKNLYDHRSHSKFLLRYHLILVCKYRYKLLTSGVVADDIKRLSNQIANKHDVKICYMEVDQDHIHYMIQTSPQLRLSDFVRTLKSYTTFHIWKLYPKWLSTIFKREHTFWTDSYFISSIGEVSSETLKNYILTQGKQK